MNYDSTKSTLAAVFPRWVDRSAARKADRQSRRDSNIETSVVGLRWWKRAIDVVIGAIALVLLSPVILVVALLVKVTSRGPVIFKQERIGLNRRIGDRRIADRSNGRTQRRDKDRRVVIKFGNPFTMYKFRTMGVEAERGKPKFAAKADPRITTIGRFLRKTRIDEIPQFANVLRGEMSIVGPRPERAYFIGQAQKEIPDFQVRLRTKPGITGLAQVELGYTNTIKGLGDKLNFDLEYIGNLSLSSDLKILFHTVKVVLTGKGAN